MCIVEIKTLPNVPIICEVFEGYSNTKTSQEYFHFLPQLCSLHRRSWSVPEQQPWSGLSWGCSSWEFMAWNLWQHSTGEAKQGVRVAPCAQPQGGTLQQEVRRKSGISVHLQILFSSFIFSASAEASCSAHLARSCSHSTNTNSWVGSFYIKINKSLKTPREAGRQH